jgi:hypothetical protein
MWNPLRWTVRDQTKAAPELNVLVLASGRRVPQEGTMAGVRSPHEEHF